MHELSVQEKVFFFLFFLNIFFQRMVGEKMARAAVKSFSASAAGYSGANINGAVVMHTEFEIEIALSVRQVYTNPS